MIYINPEIYDPAKPTGDELLDRLAGARIEQTCALMEGAPEKHSE